MSINIVAGACIMAAIGVLWPTSPITQVFLREQLGANKLLIGLNLTLCTFGTALALPGGWVFSRIRRRKRRWMIITTLARMCMFAPAVGVLYAGDPGLHVRLVWVVILSLTLVNTGTVFTSPGWWSWMADLIPDSILGAFFGRRWKWLLLAQSLALLAGGVVLDQPSTPEGLRWAFFGVFAFAALLAVIDPLLFWFVPEPVRPEPPRHTLREGIQEYLRPVRDPAFRGVLLGAGAYGFFFYLPNVFFALFLRGERTADDVWIGGHAPVWLLGAHMVTLSVSTALSANLWGLLGDRIGHRIVWILSSMAYGTYVAYFFINGHNYAWIALGHAVVFGLLFGGQQMAQQNMALSMAPPDRREFYMSVFSTVTQMATGLAPMFGGWLADHYRVLPWVTLPSGQPACYIHLLLAISFVGMLITLPVMVRVPDARGDAVLPWFARLLSGDLWRMAQSIAVLSSAASPSRRVRALRRIARRDGNVLLPDIRAALEDPAPAIRREALLALGRLGTSEAVDLLRWYLHEPDAAMRAPSVEALAFAEAEVPDRSSLLRRALHDPDRRVRRAAADALSCSPDAGATGDLRGLLVDERDGEVLVSAAMALSKLKDFGGVREMLELALHSTNTTVRAQMLVALADLLSDTSDFSELWRRDRRWRGSDFVRLARRLRRRARAVVLSGGSDRGVSSAAVRGQLSAFQDGVERLLERVQAEQWPEALTGLRGLAADLVRMRYAYEGDENDLLKFVSAVASDFAQCYWLITCISHACHHAADEAPEAPWDGLTLLGLYVLVHSQPME